MARWMKLKAACEYGGFCKRRLKQLVISGIIRGGPDPDNKRGDWIIDRESIDTYRQGQMPGRTPREIALEIMAGKR